MALPLLLICGLFILLLFFSLILLYPLVPWHNAQPNLKLPPSPFPSLPFLGHLLHLRHVGRNANLQSLRDTLGPIFTLHVGTTPIIFITSASLAHEALITKGLLFAARPSPPSRAFFTNNFRNISSSSYGPHWRALRRNLVQEILVAPKFSAFKPVRDRVLEDMMSSILAEASVNDSVVSVYTHVRDTILHLLLFMCFGFYMSKESLLEVAMLTDEVLSHSGRRALDDFYPILHIFDVKRRQNARAALAKQMKMYTAFIEKHKEMQKLGQLAPGSYLENLLKMQDDVSNPLSIEDLVTLCFEFTTVGTDTTVTTLEWAMARLVENPSVQQKLYDEIHEARGSADKSHVEEEDLQQFPYLQAVIKETLRLHPPGHFLLPHSTSELCTVGGYDIPTNAIVMFHVMFIAKDEELWREPLEFKPERFLGTLDVDITGSKEVRMMPFGAGRRICPGIALANRHMELIVARLVEAFQWSIPPPPAASQVDFSERVVVTVRMLNPLKSAVKRRMNTNSLDDQYK